VFGSSRTTYIRGLALSKTGRFELVAGDRKSEFESAEFSAVVSR
jgi:hypothetical protein